MHLLFAGASDSRRHHERYPDSIGPEEEDKTASCDFDLTANSTPAAERTPISASRSTFGGGGTGGGALTVLTLFGSRGGSPLARVKLNQDPNQSMTELLSPSLPSSSLPFLE